MNALIVAPNWIGDVVMAQPAMRAIARHHAAGGRVAVCGRPWLRDLLPWLNLDGAVWTNELPAADVGYLFPNSLGSAWRLFRAGARERIGYGGNARGWLLTRRLARRIDMRREHHRRFFLDIPRQLGMRIDSEHVSLSPPPDAIARGQSLLAARGLDPARTLCLAPGAQFGDAKRYPAESWAEAAAMLARDGWQWVILGLEGDRATGDRILERCEGRGWNACGETSLADALALIAAGRLMLCNDSGFMHVAAGLGRPTVAPFGATDPERTAPDGPRVRLLWRPAPCSPCLRRECRVPGHPCMANIAPADVAAACRGMLEDA